MRRTALIARLVSLAVFATVLGVAALLTVTTTPQVLADDAIDCSDPANAGAAECDPTSSITLSSSKDGQTVAPGATIDWTVEAICIGPQEQQCQNAGTSVNGPVPDGYKVRIIGPRNSCNQAATTPLVVEVTTSGGKATGTFTAPTDPGTYFYHAEHPAQQNLAGATWPDAQSNCIKITVASVSTSTLAFACHYHIRSPAGPPDAPSGGTVIVNTPNDFYVHCTLTATGAVSNIKVQGGLTVSKLQSQPTYAFYEPDNTCDDKGAQQKIDISKNGNVFTVSGFNLTNDSCDIVVKIGGAMWTSTGIKNLTGPISALWTDSGGVTHKDYIDSMTVTVVQ